jgi:5-methylcytosine-specific restriction endonuclease McrA
MFSRHCHYCGELASDNSLHRDHVKPKSRGGSNRARNLVYACGTCNSIKGNRTVEESRTRLLQKKIGWPKFSDNQLDWLRSRGFDMTPIDEAKLAFEETPESTIL